MSNRLEQFIRDHREEFDTDEPSRKVWDKIPFQPGSGETDRAAKTPVIWLSARRWSVAAAVSLLIAGGVWYLSGSHAPKKMAGVTSTDKPVAQPPAVKPQKDQTEPIEESPEDLYKEEMTHYARLVDIRHQELKNIAKDEPLLYKQFAGDVHKLDSVYENLKKQLPDNPNQEQLLEAMIQNLQLQMGLLNHQLDIIKQINHSKKAAYDKAYKIV